MLHCQNIDLHIILGRSVDDSDSVCSVDQVASFQDALRMHVLTKVHSALE